MLYVTNVVYVVLSEVTDVFFDLDVTRIETDDIQ